jgi:hypothetical protein
LEVAEVGLGLAESAEDLVFVAVEETDGGGVVSQAGSRVGPGAVVAVVEVGVEAMAEVGAGVVEERGEGLGGVGAGFQETRSGVVAVGGGDAEQVEQAGEVGVARVAGRAGEAIGQVVAAVEQPERAVAGLEEGRLDEFGAVGEGLAEAFGVEGAVVVPAFGGPAGRFIAERERAVEAGIGPDGFDDDSLEPPVLGGAVGAVLGHPVPLALLDGRGHLVGEDDPVAGQAVLQGVAGDSAFAGVGLRAGRFPGVAAVGLDLAEAGHDRVFRLGWSSQVHHSGPRRGGRARSP